MKKVKFLKGSFGSYGRAVANSEKTLPNKTAQDLERRGIVEILGDVDEHGNVTPNVRNLSLAAVNQKSTESIGTEEPTPEILRTAAEGRKTESAGKTLADLKTERPAPKASAPKSTAKDAPKTNK